MTGLRNISVAGGMPGVVCLVAGQQSGPARHHTGADTPVKHDCAHALKTVRGSGDVRGERIRALREQIRSGAYHPDPYEIARKLLERGF